MVNTMVNGGMTGMMQGAMPGGMAAPMAGGSPTMSCAMVPRCTMKFEKCQGGMRMVCTCEDKVACGMLQNLCTMASGGMCSVCCMMNGMTVCCCNLTMGMCKCDMTKEGVTITCMSGDKECCAMIQACCDCMNTMMSAGCTCCIMMNNTPVCCC
jgi:hypothetical protein